MADIQLTYAQQEIRKAANEYVSSARLRLAGTKYEKDVERLWKLLESLNTKLIRDIKK